MDTSGGKFASAVGIPVEYKPRMENREVSTREEVVLGNKYRISTPVSLRLSTLGEGGRRGAGGGQLLLLNASHLLCCQQD